MKTFIKILYALSVSSTLALSGCNDDDNPKPAAQSAFSQNRKVIEVNETVSFTNNSSNATRYEWDFGNGQTLTTQNASAIYTTPGTYTVKLTAYSSENVANTTTAVVKVGEVYLTSISINSIPAFDQSSSPWDSGSGPDLLLKFGRTANTTAWDYTTTTINNVTALPVGFTVPTPIKLTRESWDFQLEDYDSPDPNDIMDSWSGNPTDNNDKDYNTGKGIIKLTDPGFELILNYEVK